MKEKLKIYLKIKAILICICLVNFSCVKDDITEPNQEQIQVKRLQKISLNQLNNRIGNSEDFENLSKAFDVNRQKSNQFQRLEENDNPWLMTDEIAMIEKNGATYYTFRIGTTTESIDFYNLVVVFDDMGNLLSSTILEYTPNENWLQDTSQPFVGEVSSHENDIFSIDDINNMFSSRAARQCITGVSGHWECNYGNEHAPGEGTSCTSWDYIITVQYGACPPELMNGDDDDYPVDTNPPSGGGGGGSGGTASSNDDCVPAIDNPCDEEETTIMPPRDNDEPTPCDNIEKLKNDDVFKQKMVTLKNAAQQWSFEQLFTVSTDPTPNTSPSQSDNYDYGSFQGTINQPKAPWTVSSALNFQGIIHSHYSGLLSVHSVGDLADMYNVLKISSVTDNFFYGMVNDTGTAYILQINNREAFLEFGEEWLSSEKKKKKLVTYKLHKKYNVKQNNSNTQNEKGFVEMLQAMSSGITIFKSTDDTYSNYKKLSVLNNQVVENDCN